MSRFLIFALGCMMVIWPGAGSAEFYQYKDATGALIFTDDLSQVPEDQRPKMKSYESIVTQEGAVDQGSQEAPPEKKTADSDKIEKDPNWYKAEEDRLNREKNALLILKQDADTAEKRKEYNDRVQKLNKEIEDFRHKVDKYNKSLGQ